MTAWLKDIRELQAAGRDCVRVTVMDVRGSAPREIGACMLVTDDELVGSIGGGQLEYRCAHIAFATLRDRGPENRGQPDVDHGASRMRFPLGAAMGQCCGGVVDVLFEYVPANGTRWLAEAQRLFAARVPAIRITTAGADGAITRELLTEACLPHGSDVVNAGARCIFDGVKAASCVRHGGMWTLLEPIMDREFRIAVFGAGHVGSAVVNVLATLECQVRWIDSRRDTFPPSVPANVTAVESPEPDREVLAMPAGTCYLVMTHSHALDYAICEQVLRRDDFAYCGLIGSRSKRRRFEKQMQKQGLGDARLERLTCPIGIAGLDGKQPAEIAVAVAAELLQLCRQRLERGVRSDAGDNVRRLHR